MIHGILLVMIGSLFGFMTACIFIANSKQKDIKEEKYNENTRNQS